MGPAHPAQIGASAFVVLLTLLSGSWLAAPAAFWAALAALLALWTLAPQPALALTLPRPPGGPRFDLEGLVLGALACVPVLALLVWTWRQEFPLSGDHDYHLLQIQASWELYRLAWAPMLLAAALLLRLPSRRLAWAVTALLFCAARLAAGREAGFAVRYPGLTHFLLFPINLAAHGLDWAQPLNAGRLSSALAMPAWLFVLRPLVLGRRPDRWILPALAAFFLQGLAVYYFTTAYLEPWMLVGLALAGEAWLRDGTPGRRLALVLCAIAALAKEQAFLVLPLLTLGACLEAREPGERRETLGLGALCAVPFLLYCLTRRAGQVWRGAALAQPQDIFSGERLRVLGERVLADFGLAGILAAAILAVALLGGVARAARQGRPPDRSFWLALAGAAQTAFFHLDRISRDWTGYGRFQLVPMLFAGLILCELLARLPRRAGLLSSAALSLLAFSGLLSSFRLSATDTRRNFLEHTDAPVFLALDRALASLPAGHPPARVLTALPFPAIPDAYPRLAARIAPGPRRERLRSADCACGPDDAPRVLLNVVFRNRGVGSGLHAPIEAIQHRCAQLLRQSCADVVSLDADGESVAVIARRSRD